MTDDVITCESCGLILAFYQHDDDLGWCTHCRVWMTERGDEVASHTCRSCNDDLDHDCLHRPDPDHDDECGTCYRANHPSLNVFERNS